jgi:hypothetical protein
MKSISASYHKLPHLKKPGVVFLIVYWITCAGIDAGFGISGPVNPEGPGSQSFSNQAGHFLRHLIKASEDDCARVFGQYNTIISGSLDLKRVYFAPYDEVESLLDQAVNESVDSLTLFTHPLLQDKNGSAIVFSEELLKRVNQHFDFHGLFNISANGAESGSTVKMKFLVAGQGKFIVGYDRNEKIKHPDYDFATGNYDYNELFIMDAKKDSKGNPGLFNIKALSAPDSKPQWMKGPLNVDIQSMTMTSDSNGRRQILIEYNLFGNKYKMIDPIPIEKLTRK